MRPGSSLIYVSLQGNLLNICRNYLLVGEAILASTTTEAVMSPIPGAKMALLGCDGDLVRAPIALPHSAITPGRIVNAVPIAIANDIITVIVPGYRDIVHVTSALRAGYNMRGNLVIVVCRSCCRGDDDAHHEDHAHKAHQPMKL